MQQTRMAGGLSFPERAKASVLVAPSKNPFQRVLQFATYLLPARADNKCPGFAEMTSRADKICGYLQNALDAAREGNLDGVLASVREARLCGWAMRVTTLVTIEGTDFIDGTFTLREGRKQLLRLAHKACADQILETISRQRIYEDVFLSHIRRGSRREQLDTAVYHAKKAGKPLRQEEIDGMLNYQPE